MFLQQTDQPAKKMREWHYTDKVLKVMKQEDGLISHVFTHECPLHTSNRHANFKVDLWSTRVHGTWGVKLCHHHRNLWDLCVIYMHAYAVEQSSSWTVPCCKEDSYNVTPVKFCSRASVHDFSFEVKMQLPECCWVISVTMQQQWLRTQTSHPVPLGKNLS